MAKNRALNWKQEKVVVSYDGKTYSSVIQDDLHMETLSSAEIKKTLNEIPGKLTFWTSLKVDLEITLEELKHDYEAWFQEAYMDVDDMNPKKTEAWKKAKVALDNPGEADDWYASIREVTSAIKKCGAILTGFNAMVWSAREVARLTTAEISNIEISGKLG